LAQAVTFVRRVREAAAGGKWRIGDDEPHDASCRTAKCGPFIYQRFPVTLIAAKYGDSLLKASISGSGPRFWGDFGLDRWSVRIRQQLGRLHRIAYRHRLVHVGSFRLIRPDGLQSLLVSPPQQELGLSLHGTPPPLSI
jgi:hypothetical protein